MSLRAVAGVGIILTLAACGGTQGTDGSQDAISAKAPAIELGDGTGYYFDPRDVPPGTMSAQAAYNVMRGAPKKIPGYVTPRYGLLTQGDTSPPAYRMPVWGFTVTGTCVVTTDVADPGQCVQWDFARASDGHDLRVGDQQQIP